MEFKITEELKNALKEYDTEIVNSYRVEGDFTDPDGKVYEDMPPFVMVDMVSRPTDKSFIRHSIALPENWNGCFLGVGNGGVGGKIRYDYICPNVKHLYAAINTDMGTSSGRACGYENPEILKDFGWRSTYIMTRVGKLVTEAFYGKKIEHSYFFGGSTGGNQALRMAQSYPEEYEGIVAAVPANNRVNQHVLGLLVHNVLNNMHPYLEEEDTKQIAACAVEYGKMTGTADPEDLFVSRPRGDKEYVDGFLNYLKEKMPKLTRSQLEGLEKIYTGPIDPRTGTRIFNGYPIGCEAGGDGFVSWRNNHNLRISMVWAFGGDYTGEYFDYGADHDKMLELLGKDLNANDPDLSPYFNRGGKLLIYSGSSDPVVPFPDVMKYYDRVVKTVGKEATLEHARYFLVPGQGHKASPVRFSPAIVNGEREVSLPADILRLWCEEGIAPYSFDLITERRGIRIPKRIYAYCTEDNPSIEYPTCDERFL